MKTRYHYLLYFFLKITDLIIVNLSFILALKIFNSSISDFINYLFLSNYLWILATFISGAYRGSFKGKDKKIYSGSVKTFSLFVLFFLSFVAFSNEIHTSLRFIFLFYNFILIGLMLSRFLTSLFEFLFVKYLDIEKSVAVAGKNTLGLKLSAFFENGSSNFSFKGFLHEDNGNTESVIDLIRNAAKRGIKEVYVPMAIDKLNDASFLLKEAEKHCVRLKFVPDFDKHFNSYYKIDNMGGFPVLSLRNEPLEEMENRFIKRSFDIIFSLFVLIFVLSWLYPIIGLIIKFQSKGPVLFKQLRSGKDNQAFYCYKFRSMKVSTGEFKQATKNDNRITPIGKFIRKTSLDELPQFFNVLLGNMSVIGPRPHPLIMTEEYSGKINEYMVRQFLKSGITGWAQVNGFRGETKDPKLMEQRVAHDIWYLENWSLLLDLKIIYLTIYNVLKGEENAY